MDNYLDELFIENPTLDSVDALIVKVAEDGKRVKRILINASDLNELLANMNRSNFRLFESADGFHIPQYLHDIGVRVDFIMATWLPKGVWGYSV